MTNLAQMLPVPGSEVKYFGAKILQVLRVLAVLGLLCTARCIKSRFSTPDTAIFAVFRGSILLTTAVLEVFWGSILWILGILVVYEDYVLLIL